MEDQQGRDSEIVVTGKAGNVHVIFGFLTLVSAAALVRGHFGAASPRGRLVVDIVAGGLFLIFLLAWIWFARHPARLEVGRDKVRFLHRGQRGGLSLSRPGDLYIRLALAPGGRTRLPYLRSTGSDQAISLVLFDRAEVERACVAMGWQFVSDPEAAASPMQ